MRCCSASLWVKVLSAVADQRAVAPCQHLLLDHRCRVVSRCARITSHSRRFVILDQSIGGRRQHADLLTGGSVQLAARTVRKNCS